jgi:hypothetical protein
MHDWCGGEIQRACQVQPKAADIATREVIAGRGIVASCWLLHRLKHTQHQLVR